MVVLPRVQLSVELGAEFRLRGAWSPLLVRMKRERLWVCPASAHQRSRRAAISPCRLAGRAVWIGRSTGAWLLPGWAVDLERPPNASTRGVLSAAGSTTIPTTTTNGPRVVLAEDDLL